MVNTKIISLFIAQQTLSANDIKDLKIWFQFISFFFVF